MTDYTRIGTELAALAAAHPHNYTALYSDALEFDIVVDKAGRVQSAERCAQLMNDSDALRILLGRRASELAALTKAANLAYDAIDWQLECWNGDEDGPPPHDLLNAHAALFGLLRYAKDPENSGTDLPF
jgi:hypothetical protein